MLLEQWENVAGQQREYVTALPLLGSQGCEDKAIVEYRARAATGGARGAYAAKAA